MTRISDALRAAKNALVERARMRGLFEKLANIRNESLQLEIAYGAPGDAKRVLVLSPHPDDESIGCGGTLALLAESGAKIDVVYLTSGSPTGEQSVADTREQEARNAAAVLGLNDLIFLRGQDGKLHTQFALAGPLRDIIRANSYDAIFCPWPYDAHSDHASAFRILSRAAGAARADAQFWLYEVWSPLLANRLVNIDSTIGKKLNAIACHKSQLTDTDYASKFRALAEYRSLAFFSPHVRHAEAFLVCTPTMFARIG